jgi:hypothetical protein
VLTRELVAGSSLPNCVSAGLTDLSSKDSIVVFTARDVSMSTNAAFSPGLFSSVVVDRARYKKKSLYDPLSFLPARSYRCCCPLVGSTLCVQAWSLHPRENKKEMGKWEIPESGFVSCKKKKQNPFLFRKEKIGKHGKFRVWS